jgi:hypothetical protein
MTEFFESNLKKIEKSSEDTKINDQYLWQKKIFS